MIEDRIVTNLYSKARDLRRDVIEMIGENKVGHIGGSFSLAELISVLYFYKMKHDPNNPKLKERDRCILSKGHAALIQYAALGQCGYFDKSWYKTCKRLGGRLQGHPDYTKTPGIEANTGSLGQGLSIGVGMALGMRLDKLNSKVYAFMGDGEQAEGQIWEAAMAAVNFKVDNLVAILDHNKLQATGKIEERFDLLPLKSKWEGFGWNVIEINGHDIKEIINAFEDVDNVKGKPSIIIAHTVKGKGLSFTENIVGFHNGLLTSENYFKALEELSK